MIPNSYRSQPSTARLCVSGTILSLILLTAPTVVLAHGGHGDEFQGGTEATETPASIQVDAETAKRLLIKVEPAKSQQLAIGIKTTGQIETLPNKKVEVTAPIPGKVVELLVEPGASVKAGQPVAVISASELVELRVNSQEKQAQAQADLQKAEADLKLALGNYDRQQKISAAEIAQARTQLDAAQKQYDRDKAIVERKAVLKVAQENYRRQQQIAEAEIAQAQTEVAVAQEQYDRDKELAAQGAIPRRQMLESQAHLAEAKAALTKAMSRPEVLQAETEVKRAEVDLPLRDLRESEGKLAEAKAQLIKANSRREVLEAEAQLKRATSDVEVAKSRFQLSNTIYQTRLQQLGTSANDKGLVTVTAPISGKVADREVTLGQSFQDAGGKLMTIVNDSRVFATANIYEKDLDKVQIGQRVRVKIASLPDRNFEGRITRIGSLVDGSTRVVPVQAELNNPGGELKPGLFAELEVITNRTANAILAIPSSAVVDANGKKVVYVQNGNAFQTVEVTLGQTSGDLVEVKSGLFEGDSIVTQRAPQLYAQSLRGGSKPKDGEGKEAHSETTAVKTNSLPLPIWLMGISGGAALVTVASVAFWAGRRNRRPAVAVGHPEYEEMVYEIEPFLDNHKQPTLSRSIALIEERENHQKSN
ncbi:efflux RND transporter periplasmic adaptor subunit [Argonema galeatum]|uniref:efflux RND transporter periplasmic adaptor subunit n=1 Tax=Argonema galeatum TaxID=2942762 RepID=UPI002011A0D6|nr:efflux RND transporter periplasmic adaptor subunit [Argonema galeatum]MCL1466222.1 efflux RND transporter periplasmic adaptor subunit [Argonema galeatum A003/A1]